MRQKCELLYKSIEFIENPAKELLSFGKYVNIPLYGKGGELMVQETMQAVKEAENKAEQILKAAAEEASAILDQAKVQAQEEKEKQIRAAQEKAASDMAALRSSSEKEWEGQSVESEKDIAALRELASAKEAQAIDLVISKLY